MLTYSHTYILTHVLMQHLLLEDHGCHTLCHKLLVSRCRERRQLGAALGGALVVELLSGIALGGGVAGLARPLASVPARL